MSVEFLAGMAGIVLGILALFVTAANYLLAPAVIVFGAAMLLSTRTLSRLSWMEASSNTAGSQEFVAGATGGHLLIGLAAIVLGILALVGLSPIILIDVAFICLGFGVLVVGSAYGTSAVRG